MDFGQEFASLYSPEVTAGVPVNPFVVMDYNIKPLGRTCSRTGEPLAPGSLCYSALVLEQGELVRQDFSEEGWSGPPENALAHWRAATPDAVEEKVNPLDPDVLFEYFERLSEEPNELQEKMRYVLALLLVRKRRLQIEGTRTDDDESYLMFAGVRGEGNFEVRDPDLSDSEIEELQVQLVPA
ncbi:MAG: hypothetical protein AB8G99_12620 [Planctomycetaceae bacterium]